VGCSASGEEEGGGGDGGAEEAEEEEAEAEEAEDEEEEDEEVLTPTSGPTSPRMALLDMMTLMMKTL
jgi:hypothetical protein